ncbi:acyl-CoA dehydrogenase family protein [Burkholderia pseudomultivorans]|uniref:acyl-CoA dehydrogenase family protein n=1 Tax=Burkholderia pseudomultivorans TaxID=1207504 RepID=UPI002874FB93|nr:acyl-CoA dehydrogenase family protein [Burkholderia pseudomultivorans]MDS0858610.1 acyl-CoA dehydrogenase family protein [Burkholderia pseudomultivorans]
MSQSMKPPQVPPSLATIWSGLSACGLELDQLAARMRMHGPEADRTGQIPDAVCAPQDLPALNLNLVPSAHGGCPCVQSLTSRVALMEYLGYADAALALALPGPGLAMPPVLALGSGEQQARFFERFLSHTPRWGAFAITEPDCGSDATAMRTTARKTAHGWVLNGTKCFITNGARADDVITFATINRHAGRFGVRAFHVDRNIPGFSVERVEKMVGLRASQLAVLSYNDCEVPDDALLRRGDEKPLNDAFSGAQHAWDYFRPLLSAVMVGACRRVRDDLAAYLEAGRHPVNRGQRTAEVKDALLDIDRQITTAYLLVQHAAWKTDQGMVTSVDASIAKAYASQVAARVTRTSIDLAGLAGIAAFPSLEQSYRDAKAFDIMEGTGDLQRLMIARAALRSTSLSWEATSPVSHRSTEVPSS